MNYTTLQKVKELIHSGNAYKAAAKFLLECEGARYGVIIDNLNRLLDEYIDAGKNYQLFNVHVRRHIVGSHIVLSEDVYHFIEQHLPAAEVEEEQR
jgi:hypothetical protein